MKCRFCSASLEQMFVSLGATPLSNSYLTVEDLGKAESFYPLEAYVCPKCFLVQLNEYESPERIFSDYSYFSSYSESWLKHAAEYADRMVELYGIGPKSFVVEVASNDGYLLQYFMAKNVNVLGIEPARNVAGAALRKGVPTVSAFFGSALARRLASEGKADLLLGNNVLAHVPDLNDFVEGLKIMLKPGGVITMEFPHLMRLVEGVQFDTIYHEHFSYFSLMTVERIFAAHGLTVFDVEELATHGGSLRIHATHSPGAMPVSGRVHEMRRLEENRGYADIGFYRGFGEKVKRAKREILAFLVKAKNEGKTIAGYGAPAKGNTLLNYCGIKTDFIDYTVDRNPRKQNKFLPGSRIPVEAPERIRHTRPDYLFILPWNLKDEIIRQMSFIREWGGRFVVPMPEVRVI